MSGAYQNDSSFTEIPVIDFFIDCQAIRSYSYMFYVVCYRFYTVFCRNKFWWFSKRSYTPRKFSKHSEL